MKRTALSVLCALMPAFLHAQQPLPASGRSAVAKAQGLHIYLLMGQSNMVGRDTSQLQSQVDNPHVLSFNAENEWVVAREPIHPQLGPIPVGQGPGIPFALEMLKTHPGLTIGLVPCAVGGLPLSRWVKGADLYERCVARARAAAASGSIDGVLWHQGESDSNTQQNADTYESRLVQMFKDLRKDLARPDLPIVVGQIGPWLDPVKNPYVDTVRASIRRIPSDLPHVAYADSAGLQHKGDSIHFNADSQKIFGARYAAAMQAAAKGTAQPQ